MLAHILHTYILDKVFLIINQEDYNYKNIKPLTNFRKPLKLRISTCKDKRSWDIHASNHISPELSHCRILPAVGGKSSNNNLLKLWRLSGFISNINKAPLSKADKFNQTEHVQI